MHIDDFDFSLPEKLIAVEPLKERDRSRLLHVHKNGITDLFFNDILDVISSGDCLVFNNTKVIPARLKAISGGAEIDINLLKRLETKNDSEIWEVLAKPAKKIRKNKFVKIADDFEAELTGENEGGSINLEFNSSGKDFLKKLDKYGLMPLPPYISKKRQVNKSDGDSYQTVYASKVGAVAAPTAGLHFTDNLIYELQQKGVNVAYLTLHVGGGTFLPVKVENPEEHKMHSEYYEIDEINAEIINKSKHTGGKIVAVGTTAVRTLESCVDSKGKIVSQKGDTDIFIKPGFDFKVVDRMITNFHLPKSTLMMLISAFAGRERILSAYSHAVSNEYRFFSYGDACFLERMT